MEPLRVTHARRLRARPRVKPVIATSTVPAGFPSPAENYIERTIGLNEDWLVPRRAISSRKSNHSPYSLHCLSSTFRTLRIKLSGVNGFSMNSIPSSSTPRLTIESSV